MGGLFTVPSNTAAFDEYTKKREELLKQNAELQAEIDAHTESIEQQKAEQYEKQTQDAKQAILDIKETIRLAEEMRDAQKARNTQAAVLLCAMLYNYPFGKQISSAIDDVAADWTSNAESIIESTVNLEAFKLITRIPQVLPALWCTGEGDDNMHNYSFNVSDRTPGVVNSYIVDINTYIAEYIPTLKKRISNIFQYNTTTNDLTDEDEKRENDSKCATYIAKAVGLPSDGEWVSLTLEFIKDVPFLRWIEISAETLKGICANKIRVLPAAYPRICSKVELANAIVVLGNSIFYNFGQCKNENGVDITIETGKSFITPTMKGGQCFNLNDKWLKNMEEYAFKDLPSSWNWEDFKYVDECEISVKDITGDDDDEWMSDLSLCNELKLVYDAPLVKPDQIGTEKYVNPTMKYTSLFLNDLGSAALPFAMPKISASMYDDFNKRFLPLLMNSLLNDENMEKYNVYNVNNSNLMTFLDFMTTIPPELKDKVADKTVPPLSSFMYVCMVLNSCKWTLTFPIDNTMSMGKINNAIMEMFNNDDKMLPQYIWTKTNKVDYKYQDVNNVKLASLREFKHNLSDSVLEVRTILRSNVEELEKKYNTE